MRDEEEVKQAFEAQASSADESRELCDIFGLDSGGRHDDRRDRLLSLLSGPSSRRRIGWLDLLLQVHAAGAQSFDELEPSDLEAAVSLTCPSMLRRFLWILCFCTSFACTSRVQDLTPCR